MKVAILGCGPAGMIAAHSLESNDVLRDNIDIFDKDPSPNPIQGAQFLHKPIVHDHINGEAPDGIIHVAKIGTKECYAEKVYGDSTIMTSFGSSAAVIPAWSLDRVYERLWEEFNHRIEELEINPDVLREDIIPHYDLVLSSIPPDTYCTNPAHDFHAVEIMISDPVDTIEIENFILYNGRSGDLWYRASNIFGHSWFEYGTDYMRNHDGRSIVDWSNRIGYKPTGTTCDCLVGPKFSRIGRFGRWDRSVLLHNVPDQVNHLIARATA